MTAPTAKTCGTCLLRSRGDRCCTLTGRSVTSETPACAEHSDGKVVERKPRLVHIDARPRRVIEAERAIWADNEQHERARI
jgi:hypothetical protein